LEFQSRKSTASLGDLE